MNKPKNPKSLYQVAAYGGGMLLIVFIVLSLLPIRVRATAQSPQQNTLSPWVLQWKDEFNATTRSGVSTKWIYDTGTQYPWPNCPSNWGTGEEETATQSLSNVYQNGAGKLVIKAVRRPDGKWYSGRIETKRLNFQAPAGGAMAVEARIQVPQFSNNEEAQGYWPAFWMLGAPFRANQNCTLWPGVGEIDIMENRSNESITHVTLHCDMAPGGECNEFSGVGGVTNMDRGPFHVYRVELDKSVSPQEIRWYLDGQKFFTITSSQFSAEVWDAATHHGFFILLDMAMGGGFPGGSTPGTRSGGRMLVDYVRVYYANPTP